MFQMSLVGVAPVLASLKAAFPGTSDLTVQMTNTVISLLMIAAALLSSTMRRAINRRMIAALGLILLVVAAVCGYFLSLSLALVFLWAAIIGVGTGMFVPVAASLIVDYYDETENAKVAGQQAAGLSLGGTMLCVLAGLLASVIWNASYLVFFTAIPAIILTLRFVPSEARLPRKAAVQRTRIPKAVWICTLFSTLFGVTYFAFSTNISLYLAESGREAAVLSGVITGVFLFGGAISGVLLTRIIRLFGTWTPVFSLSLLLICHVIMYFSTALPVYFVGAILGGASLTIMFPFLLLTISKHVDESNSLMSSSMLITMGPNIGAFLSPVIITGLSAVITGTDAVRPRFGVAIVFTLVFLAGLVCVSATQARAARNANYSQDMAFEEA